MTQSATEALQTREGEDIEETEIRYYVLRRVGVHLHCIMVLGLSIAEGGRKTESQQCKDSPFHRDIDVIWIRP